MQASQGKPSSGHGVQWHDAECQADHIRSHLTEDSVDVKTGGT